MEKGNLKTKAIRKVFFSHNHRVTIQFNIQIQVIWSEKITKEDRTLIYWSVYYSTHFIKKETKVYLLAKLGFI